MDIDPILSGQEDYKVILGDCITGMVDLPEKCIDFSVYSPPFMSVYAYTSLPEDIGNCDELLHEPKIHFGYFFRQMVRVMKPGRIMMVHCSQIIRMKRAGGQGTFDFRGLLIRLAERVGFIYDYDWVVRKGPQQQAIVTKSRSLQFAGLEANRLQSHGANPDYLIRFIAPGDAETIVDSPGQVSRNEWIDLAECTWDAKHYPISIDGRKASMTLNREEATGPDDVKHICPLQLSLIDNLVRLYTNPGELVFSPFTGIGSEGFVSVRRSRRFFGFELKTEYHAAALGNLARAAKMRDESNRSLFDLIEEGATT